MTFRLKDYQQRALNALSTYFRECAETGDADTAFYSTTKKVFGTGIPYIPVKELPGLPYVCLRVPTGGGKTVMGCHSVGVAMRDLLQTDTAIVLWLVPSNPIREQTITRLKDSRDPYRQALESVAGTIEVMDVNEALSLRRADLDGGTVVIISTMQAFRRDDTEGLRVYRESGSLMNHFDGLPPNSLAEIETYENGKPYPSLANVLRLRRPIVIVDEAHNSRTPLSFETLSRFNPSCIVEFTATPDRDENPSNVVHTVSAAELKAEAVIKMPIRLETRSDWRELLADAIACRKNLEDKAKLEQQQTGEYIRPVMLIQAQPNRSGRATIGVEEVKNCLIEDHGIAEDWIAIRTGTQNELDDVDISDPLCPIRFVITIQALREGWDCPFAYVLCSVAEMRSNTAVEQILGRVMRLPRVAWKEHQELNMAYAFAASPSFIATASALKDALVESGFERQEAKDLIISSPDTQQGTLPFGAESLLGAVTIDMPKPPKERQLSPSTTSKIDYDRSEKKFTFRGAMTREERRELQEACSDDESRDAIEIAYRISNGLAPDSHGAPSEANKPFIVPFLAIRQGTLFEPFEETHFLDHPWKLTDCVASLSEEEYSSERRQSQHGLIDEKDGHITTSFVNNLQEQMTLFASDTTWGASDLVHWLRRNIPHHDLPPQEVDLFFSRIIQGLMRDRSIPIEQLCHDKYRLKIAMAAKLNEHRDNARHSSLQALLALDCETPLEVTPECCFAYDPRQYPYGRPYRGHYIFHKHYYPEIGDLNATGEEFECAQFIDQLDEVEYWVRNVERRPNHSFWLQTSTDRFYPDFVCKLKDDRILVVEYKGGHLASGSDAEEKQMLGELWEKRSEGHCLFIMPSNRDFESIRRKVES
ncbi:MAG: DEAD/DEAH box helicase family protein [Lentisphaerae bacterium]|nr:DEAD/DEAH box helicase family protein [Lentisphaerota bacterium]